MITIINKIAAGVNEVLFPNICAVCGFKLTPHENSICSQCLQRRFEPAESEYAKIISSTILPEGVLQQHALWKFDKGGHLQDLLHLLKYKRVIGVGIDMGRQLGKSLLDNSFFRENNGNEKMILLPVPLHAKKRRIRGYNQAYYIAKGLKDVTKIPVVSQKAVQRIKNTKTQTGFSLEKRQKNIEKAFVVMDATQLKNKICIIVDDVFTTGATTFELATALQKHEISGIIIATIAQT